MPPPRGLKKVLKETQLCKLVGAGKTKSFKRLHQGQATGQRLQGLHRSLQARVYSGGEIPDHALRASARRPGGHWGGPDGGRRRGARVDAQISRIVNLGPSGAKSQHVYNLTKTAFAALARMGLTPVLAQRCLCYRSVATAADLIAFEEGTEKLCVVELKCGFDCGRDAAARALGQHCRLQAPFDRARDCLRHRHLAQLTATCGMLLKESALFAKLANFGISDDITGYLLYVNDEGAEVTKLDGWWFKRKDALLQTLAR